jgi:hypothetical protein
VTVKARLIQNFFISIMTGTIFWNIPVLSYNTRFGSIYQITIAVASEWRPLKR